MNKIPKMLHEPRRSLMFTTISSVLMASAVQAAPEVLLDSYSVDPADTLTVKVNLVDSLTDFGPNYGVEISGIQNGSCFLSQGLEDKVNDAATQIKGEKFAEPNTPPPINWIPGVNTDPFPQFSMGAPYNCASDIYRVRVIHSQFKNPTAALHPDVKDNSAFTTFTVNPGTASTNDILLLDGLTERVGENNFGGKSLFDFNSTGGQAASVDILRPMGQNLEVLGMAEWLNDKGFSYDAMSMLKLASANLNSYKVVIIVGRSSLWTDDMRLKLDAYVANGGNVMFLGSENMRYNATLTATKLQADTSSAAGQRAVSDVKASTGLAFTGFVNDPTQNFLPAGQGNNGAYLVGDAKHWVFTGAGITGNGDVFGLGNLIVGPSVDGATIAKDANGKVTLPENDGFEVIAYSPAKTSSNADTFGVAGLFHSGSGGWVFNAGTARWEKGLNDVETGKAADPVVETITQNVIKAFRNGMTDSDQDGVPKGVDPDDNDPAKPGDNTGTGSGTGGGTGSGGGAGSGSGNGTGSGGGSGSGTGTGSGNNGGGGGSLGGAALLSMLMLSGLRRRRRL